ncbi:tetratricopeptide repeat-containing diguanylate cyclase [Dyella jiangningensis]|uniref:diguanylate cyclase n=1 Tax=Dyella jiangningensis TaxID=1379159 RepID=A0A328P0G3_9GAMM|nr:GGDEF domain-containing protein [Dyella jiangningensis]RAO74901.1 GGDEF domain-containing protein [Dyella jiangningensis]
MPRRWHRFTPWAALAAMAFCVTIRPSFAQTHSADLGVQLEQAESLRTADHPRFLARLNLLRSQAAAMSMRERWHLRYLEAWEASFQGDYVNAEPRLRDVIDHSDDPALAVKASAILMGDWGSNKRYEEAFELANQLVEKLPGTQDKLARFVALSYLSQLLRSAGQYELAANYAHDMAQDLPAGETACKPLAMRITALYETRKLTSSSPELQEALDACQAARDSVFTNALWLVKSDLHLDENEPLKAVQLLLRIAPSVRSDQYYSNMLTTQVQLAQAYLKLGKDDAARKAAQAALALSDPGDISETLRDAYRVLYSLDKKQGNTAAALADYEHYVAQDVGYLNDVSARALAYAMAKQHVIVQKLETEKLSRENNILRLKQALDAKAVETIRLYVVLLLLVLASAVFWLLRLKRSQLHFKKLSSIDGLTGVYNHQHFMGEAGKALHLLERRQGMACLFFIDLDNFKHINDTHGHATGDAVLRRTVTICRQQLRPTDLFGRLGGEEFGILLLDCTREQGMRIAERIRRAIDVAKLEGDAGIVTFSASVGLASTEYCGHDLQRLCREADAALYRAKRAGRNRVVSDTEEDGLVEA